MGKRSITDAEVEEVLAWIATRPTLSEAARCLATAPTIIGRIARRQARPGHIVLWRVRQYGGRAPESKRAGKAIECNDAEVEEVIAWILSCATQAEAGRLLGTDQANVNRFASGKVRPGAVILQRVRQLKQPHPPGTDPGTDAVPIGESACVTACLGLPDAVWLRVRKRVDMVKGVSA